jgi:PKD repeat protein
MMNKTLRLLVSLGLFLCVFSHSQAQNSQHSFSATEIDKGMQAGKYETGKLMVKWKNQAIYRDKAAFLHKTFQVSAIRPFFAPQNQNIQEQLACQQLGLQHLTEISIAPNQIKNFINYLQTNYLAAYIEPVTNIALSAGRYVPNDASVNLQWGLAKAKVFEAWAISKGSPQVVIGIIDTGISPTHEDLRSKLFYNQAERRGIPNFDDDQNGYIDDSLGYDFGNRDADVQDAIWHGTNVAGVAAAQADNNVGIAGVGFHASILPVKVMRDFVLRPTASNASIYEGLIYAANRGCQIINMSVINDGDDGVYFQHQQDAINYATLVKKALVIVATGNNNRTNVPFEATLYPASYNNVLSIAATDRFDERYQLSIVNHFVDLAAPGVEIQTTHNANNNSYNSATGSSFAAPFVAGAAALLKSNYPLMTGLQIGELLRVTTDDIYQIAVNQPFKDKLGTGRINVENAFLQQGNAISVRLQDLNYTNKWGKLAYNDDTLRITGNFINYLNKVTNLQVKLQAMSPFVTVLQNTYNITSLNTLDSAKNTTSPFVVYLNPNTPPNTKLVFKLSFTNGGNYNDYQYFTIDTNEETYNITWNDIKFSTAANGRLGYTDEANKKGLGIGFNNSQTLKEAGLMIGYKGKVANCVLTTPNNKANHFKAGKQARKTEQGLQHLIVSSDFTDENAGNNKIGLKISQKITERINTPHHQYALVEYAIENTSGEDIDSLAVGLFADWDIDNARQNKAAWQPEHTFAYAFGTNSYMGIKAFGGNSLSCFSIDKLNAAQNPINFNLQDSFSIPEKFYTLQNGLNNTNAGQNIGTDVAQVVGTKIGNFKKGEIRTLVFAIMAANSLANLAATAQETSKQVNFWSAKGKKPTTHPFICAEKLSIVPKIGKKFRFYNTENLGVPFSVGSALQVSAADTSKTYYISQVDSTLESDLQVYKFKLQKAKALFFAVDSLNLVDSSRIWFFNGSSNILRSDWNFGDNNFATLANPIHSYNKTGIYTVTLTITDSLGCVSSMSKQIKVVRLSKSLLPIVQPIKVCAKESILIKPQNGTNFRFYADEKLKKLLAAGKEFLLKDINIPVLYITGADSLVESPPIKAFVNRTYLDARFETSVRADTILYERVVFNDRSRGANKLVQWEWDFGDGKPKVYSPNPSYLYDKQGTYQITLKVTDDTGCSDKVVKVFKVGKKSPNPILPTEQVVCEGNVATLTPKGGKVFWFFDKFSLDSLIASGSSYAFVPTKNQTIYVVCADSLVESEPTPVYVQISKPLFEVQIPAELKMYETPTVRFAVKNADLVAWYWEFGDGNTSTDASPLYRYNKQGNYVVKATLTDRWGCKYQISQNFKAINQANSPIIPTQTACLDKDFLLSPNGGSLFNFYTQYPDNQAKPLASGRNFLLKQVQQETDIYVTCVDSLAESVPTKATIKLSKVDASFVLNLDTLNRYEKDSLLVSVPKQDKLARYSWTIDGKNFGNEAKAALQIDKDGIYEIALQVTDANGCSATSSKKVQVLYDSNVPLFNKLNLYPNPSRGDLKVDLQLRKPNEVRVVIYNSIGQVVEQTENQYFKNYIYDFDLHSHATGLYFIRFMIGNKEVVRKVVLE